VSDSLPVFRLIAEPLAQDLIDDRDLGRRSKLGGQPTWIQMMKRRTASTAANR